MKNTTSAEHGTLRKFRPALGKAKPKGYHEMNDEPQDTCANCFYHEWLETSFGGLLFCHYYGEEVEESDNCKHHAPEEPA